MRHTDGLPLVIARPGIVVGDGGPLQHWGVGRWHGSGAVKLWGNGTNILPFVLADDVSDGLIAMMERPEAINESFNLTGEPLLTGRDYFEAIHRRAGAKLKVRGSNLTALWLANDCKYLLKRYGLQRKAATRSSLADWQSRGHLSPFNNEKPKRLLGWRPEADRETFLRRAIDEAHLFW